MTTIAVECEGERGETWTCSVTLRDGDRDVSTHGVRVKARDLERLAPGAPDPARLVETSFAFLLEREPPGSILRSFDLMEIAQYFPEYEREVASRLAR